MVTVPVVLALVRAPVVLVACTRTLALAVVAPPRAVWSAALMPRWMTGVAMTVSWMVLALARQVRPELASVGVAVTEATWRKLLHKVRLGPRPSSQCAGGRCRAVPCVPARVGAPWPVLDCARVGGFRHVHVWSPPLYCSRNTGADHTAGAGVGAGTAGSGSGGGPSLAPESASAFASAGGAPRVLSHPRSCYICKARFVNLHHFYDQLCPGTSAAAARSLCCGCDYSVGVACFAHIGGVWSDVFVCGLQCVPP